jgi:hypothetical protein
MGLLFCMAYAHLHLLFTGNVGFFDCWRIVFSNWNLARIFSMVFLGMKMKKHTLGNWTVHRKVKSTELKDLFIYAGAEKIARVVVPYTAQRNDEFEANAELIAAAPDLLEALQNVLRVTDRATVEFFFAKAAIAKATGEPK